MTDLPANPEEAPRRRPPAAPIFAATVFFCGGILLQSYTYKPAGLYFLCTLLLALCSLLALRFARGRWRALLAYASAVLAFFPAGAFCSASRQALAQPSATVLEYAGGEEVTLTGYVARSGSLRGGRDLHESLDLAVEQAQRDGEEARAVNGRVRLNLYVPGAARGFSETEEESPEDSVAPPVFDYGQRLRIAAKLRPPVNFRNPGDMDYVEWLHGQQVAALGSAKSTNVDVLPGLGGSRFERVRWRVRRSVLERMQRLWPAPYAGLFQAMVLGERGLVNRERRLEFQRSGTFHLLVVSGMNVAVFAVFLLWVMRWLRLPAEYAIVSAILLTCSYAWLTELGAPILRSVLMIVAYQIAALLNRDRAPLNTVSIAALVLLAGHPDALFDPSFQLTFIAVLTIAGIGVPVFTRTTGPLREALDDVNNISRDRSLRPEQAQFRLDVRAVSASLGLLVGRRTAEWLVPKTTLLMVAIAELALLSALMQTAITLPTVWYFHRINAHAIWANMAVLPLTSLLMPTSMLAVALSYVAEWMAMPFVTGARLALHGILLTVHWSGGAQLTDVRVAMPGLWLVALFAAAYATALLLARRHRALAAISLAVLLAAAWGLCVHPKPFAFKPQALEITAIDIGQGDSFLLVTPNGHTLLLDSGGLMAMSHSELDIGEDVVSPYLWQRGVSQLDAVAFSHGHADHMGGMTAIMRNFHPHELWYAANYPSREVVALWESADQLRVRRVKRHEGESFDFDGVKFEVLSPPNGWELKPRGQDDASLVLRVTYAGHSALLPGDIHSRMEKMLVEQAVAHHFTLHADLLKVPHHGSNTSSSDEFLDAVHPEFAVVSAGVRNPFRHPRPEVISRLAEHKARTYRTDLFGPVTFYLDATGVHSVVER